MVLPEVGWAFPQYSTINKMPQRHGHANRIETFPQLRFCLSKCVKVTTEVDYDTFPIAFGYGVYYRNQN